MNARKVDALRAQKCPFRIADAAVLIAIVLLTVVLLGTLDGEAGNGVEIVHGNEHIVLPLDQNAQYSVDGCLTVIVRDGKAWVQDARCKNRICEKTGKIGRVGESIVCAQNGVAITVTGKSSLAGTVGK